MKNKLQVSYIDFEKEIEAIEKAQTHKEVLTERFEDFDEAYKKSIDNGTGFVIDERIDYSKYFSKETIKDIQEIVYENSVFSYKFGIALEDEERVIDKLYQCDCGETTGIENLGAKCPNCKTCVTRMKPKRVGWFILRNHKIIHPFILFMIHKEASPIKPISKRLEKKLLSEKLEAERLEQELAELTSENIEDDLDEDEVDELKDIEAKLNLVRKKQKKTDQEIKKPGKSFLTLEEALNQNKLEDFTWKDLFEEDGVKMEAFINKYMKPKRDLLMMYKNIWYVSKLPVLSKNYRYFTIQQIEVTETNRINMHPLNLAYMKVSGLINALNGDVLNNSPSWIVDQKKSLASVLGYIGKLIFSDIGSSKRSYIRGEVYGKKYSFSGRLVLESITDRSSYKIDECEVPLEYVRSTFVTDLVKIGVDLEIPIKRLHNITDIDYKLTPSDRELLMNTLIPKIEYPIVYINREPDIYVTSITALKIAKVTDEMVLRIPFALLPSIVGDFDFSRKSDD